MKGAGGVGGNSHGSVLSDEFWKAIRAFDFDLRP